MVERKNRVAVILVNYNSSQYTLDCVNSICEKTSRDFPFQIIVVDNNSSQEEARKLDSLFSMAEVQLVFSEINVGFSGANMIGVKLANADYYYFLNNDCLLLNDCLGILYSFMESNIWVANCSGEMFTSNLEYEANFGYFPTLSEKLIGSGLLRLLYPGRFPDKRTRMLKPTPVDLVNGSSMFIRASAFEEIGGMDTTYFLYCEEEDIALRLKRNGHMTYIVPDAKYQHFVSRSTKGDNAINLVFLKEFYISFLYYFRKNYNSAYCVAIQLFFFFKTIRKFYRNWDFVRLAFFIIQGAPMKDSLRFKQTMKGTMN